MLTHSLGTARGLKILVSGSDPSRSQRFRLGSNWIEFSIKPILMPRERSSFLHFACLSRLIGRVSVALVLVPRAEPFKFFALLLIGRFWAAIFADFSYFRRMLYF